MNRVARNFVCKTLLGVLCLGLFVAGSSAQSPQQPTVGPAAKYDFATFHLAEQVGDDIPNLLAKSPGNVTLYGSEETGLQGALPDKPGEPPFEVMSKTCGADLVIAGTATTNLSHMTARNSFLYTDWTFATSDVLKNNPAFPILVGESVIVARPGGTLTIDGRKVQAKVTNFPDFESDRSYLLYLKLIPGTKSYRADSYDSIPLSEGPGFNTETAAKLLTDTSEAVALETGKAEGAWNTSFCAGGNKVSQDVNADLF
jgi:hypothetical protein